ncbi:MAG TPA: hypothetical protein DD633_08100 [Sphaerochaeta sp.]|nr:hypothetical protein [Sphaerochaeta sp.]
MSGYTAEVDAYIKQFDDERQQRLQTIRTLVHSLCADVQESISWKMPTFRLPGGGNIIQMAAFKAHIGLYPEPEAIEVFKTELAGFPTSKGAIQLPLKTPLPLPLIGRISAYRLKVNS